jgi:hypothetical protein
LRPRSGSCPERSNAEGGETTRTFARDDPCDLDGLRNEDEKLVRDFARAFAENICFAKSVSIART